MTVVPSTDGLWTPWSPNALSQIHPYLWHVIVVIDHYSRRIMGFNIFKQNPTANQVASSMKHICDYNNVKPKYLVSDKGTQLTSTEFCNWCTDNEIKQRFGAVGKHGSIAVIERAILTCKVARDESLYRYQKTKCRMKRSYSLNGITNIVRI